MLILKREPRLDARQQAFLYQVQAVEGVRRLEYAALFHEQGLGKTKIGIDLALSWLKEGVVDSFNALVRPEARSSSITAGASFRFSPASRVSTPRN